MSKLKIVEGFCRNTFYIQRIFHAQSSSSLFGLGRGIALVSMLSDDCTDTTATSLDMDIFLQDSTKTCASNFGQTSMLTSTSNTSLITDKNCGSKSVLAEEQRNVMDLCLSGIALSNLFIIEK